MLRIFRNIILLVVFLLAVSYGAIWYFSDSITQRIERPLTREYIGKFAPSDDADYGYSTKIRFYPMEVLVNELSLEGSAIKVEDTVWNDARIKVEKIAVELMPILKEDKIVLRGYENRTFEGRLSISELEKYLENQSESIRDLKIDTYRGRCRMVGHFGVMSSVPITLYGDWVIDDRNVITLANREYHNPDSPVPDGAIEILERNVSFDVRVKILGDEMKAREVNFSRDGLEVKFSDTREE